MIILRKDRSVKPNQRQSKVMFQVPPKDHVSQKPINISVNGKVTRENSRSPTPMFTRIIFDGVRRFRSFSTAKNTRVFPKIVDRATSNINENHNILAPAKWNCGVIVVELDISFFECSHTYK